jgi:hypothetical protein
VICAPIPDRGPAQPVELSVPRWLRQFIETVRMAKLLVEQRVKVLAGEREK